MQPADLNLSTQVTGYQYSLMASSKSQLNVSGAEMSFGSLSSVVRVVRRRMLDVIPPLKIPMSGRSPLAGPAGR